MRGPEGFKQLVSAFRTAFPDIRHTVEDQVSERDKVATRVTGHGTHRGDLMGIPPTGKEVTIPGIVVNRISEGRIEEGWFNYDALGLMQQLGIIPQPEQAEEASSTLEGASDPHPLAP